jgi:hypothetical protein
VIKCNIPDGPQFLLLTTGTNVPCFIYFYFSGGGSELLLVTPISFNPIMIHDQRETEKKEHIFLEWEREDL